MRKALLLALLPTLFYSLAVTAQTELEMNEQAYSQKELKRWVEGTVEGDVCAGSVRPQKMHEK